MIELERMTTLYVASEDRISLTANVKTGGTARFWLTRRIADLLVAALVKAVKPVHKDPAYAQVIGEMAQTRAEQRHEPVHSVQTDCPDHEWLVRKIDLALGNGGVLMMLCGPQEEQARLALPTELLRQWLGILHKVYQTAEWPTGSWPASVGATAPLPQSSVVLH